MKVAQITSNVESMILLKMCILCDGNCNKWTTETDSFASVVTKLYFIYKQFS